MLCWLKENNCPVDETVWISAAINFQMESLKWLKENGYARYKL